MTTFDEREHAFENKFSHDLETLFKIKVRRAKLLGQWAAGHMGLTGEDAEVYSRAVADDDFNRKDGGQTVDRIMNDFGERGIDMSRHRVEREAEHLLQVARDQIMKA